jgi:hypothetical protein
VVVCPSPCADEVFFHSFPLRCERFFTLSYLPPCINLCFLGECLFGFGLAVVFEDVEFALHVLSAEKATCLTLGDQTLDGIFPGLEPGDFTVLHGAAASFMTFVLSVRCQMPTGHGGLESSAIYVDGGNSFNPYIIAEIARRYGLDSRAALERIHVSRAFTAYQFSALVLEKLGPFLRMKRSKLLVISDISSLFFDKDVPETDARDLFMKVCDKLAVITAEKQIVVVVRYFPEKRSRLGLFFETVLFGHSDVLIRFKRSACGVRFVLEEHPRVTLFSMDFPEDYVPLATFAGV